jgi:hypothetical protein
MKRIFLVLLLLAIILTTATAKRRRLETIVIEDNSLACCEDDFVRTGCSGYRNTNADWGNKSLEMNPETRIEPVDNCCEVNEGHIVHAYCTRI